MLERREFIAASAAALLVGCGRTIPQNAIVPDGIWTWFNDPRAIIHKGHLVIGSINSGGIVQLTSNGRTTPVADLGQVDDHNNPALLDHPEGLIPFYSRHNDKEGTRFSLGGEHIIPCQKPVTYARPFLIGNTVHLFRRHWNRSGGEHQICRSSDLKNWSVETAFHVPGHRPYVQACQSGERIDFAATLGHPSEIRTGLYHFFFDGGFFRTDGSKLPFPFDVRQATQVCEPQAWCWQIQPGRILATRYPGIEYWLYELDGDWHGTRLWAEEPALYSEQPFYAGGMCFLGEQIVQSRRGQIFVGDRQVTRTGTNIRPFSPDAKTLLWVSGQYEGFRNFSTSIIMR